MRHLLTVISAVLVLVAVVTGCGGTHRYDSRLTAADSLMRSDPDSALAIVQSVDRDSLADEGDRAYRDLLLTQACYRCYITATSDSDINCALAYYRAHSGERDKLTRAYIYKGAVMEELGHPDSAMLYYKTAEVSAAPDDYFNLGYSNLRIAELYQSLYQNDSATAFRMKQSTRYFTIINDTNYLITSIGTQGVFYINKDLDTAKVFLNKAISLAKSINSPKQFMYLSKLAGLYFYRNDYQRAKNLAMEVIKSGATDCGEDQFYYYAARSFIKLSRLDSAHYVSSIIPAPITSLDSMNRYRLAAELAEAEHRYRDCADYLAKSKEINDRLFNQSLESNISNVELQFDAEMLKTRFKKNVFNHVVSVLLVAIVVAIISSLWLTKRIKKKITAYQNDINLSRIELEKTIQMFESKISECETELAEQKHLLSKKERSIKRITKENDKLLSQHMAVKDQVSKIVRYRLSAINELYQDIRFKTSDSIPFTRSLPLISLIKDLNDKKQLSNITPKKSFWDKLKKSIDGEYQGLATYLEEKYPSMDPRDYHLFLLLCAKISPQIIKLCMNYSHPVTVSNYKRKLIKEITGQNMGFDEFIQSYLDGKIV